MARDVVLFDGVCALCDSSVRFLLARDPEAKLAYAQLQGETARAVLARHPGAGAAGADETLSTMLYVRGMGTESEQLYDRSDAAFEILHDLGGVWRLVAWLRFIPRPIRNTVYDFIARRRYRWFGKYDACRLPEAGTNERFLP